VVLIQSAPKIEPDLTEVLLSLQKDGLSVARQLPWHPWQPRVLIVRRPLFIVDWWNRLVRFGFARKSDGSFGERIPPGNS
jgi:hypothetical protein